MERFLTWGFIAAVATAILFTLTAHGATVPASSASYSDVAAAVATANTGDTVTVPAGAVAWTTQLTLSKAITIKGAGSALTVITNAIHVNDWYGLQALIYVTTATGNTRITGIGIDGQWESGGNGIVINTANKAIRIDHCFIKRCPGRAGQMFSASAGVWDHNVTVDCWSLAGVYGDQCAAFTRAEANAYADLGTTNCWVFEDNYDVKTGAYWAPTGIDGGWGGQYTYRHNVLSNIGLYNFDYVLDAHGNQGSPYCDPSTSIAGTVFVESYDNFSSAVQQNRGNAIRGGTMIFFNNTYLAGSGNMVTYNNVFHCFEEDGYRPGNPIVGSWPAYQQLTNSYFWRNTFNGALVAGVTTTEPTDPTFIQQNRDWWLYAPSTNWYRPLSYPHPRIVADNDPAIPAAFALVSPAPAATGVSIEPTVQWGDSDIETSYVIEIAKDYYFSTNVYRGTAAQNATTKAIPGGTLSTLTTYYWRVLAAGANGTNTSTGPPHYFTTGSDTAVPGALAFASATYSVNENAGTVTISVTRTGGTDGAVDVDFATAAGTAAAGVNYSSTNNTLSWAGGDGAAKTFDVPILVDGAYTGDLSLTATLSNPTGGATLASPTTTTITIVNTDAAPAIPLMAGLTFHAYEGQITSLFGTNASGYVRQTTDTDDPANGGLVAWRVTIPSTANYTMSATVDAPTTAANSFFVDFDTDPPVSPTAIWDVTSLTTGLESRPVGWRGNGTSLPQFPTNVWSLTAGVHTLYLRGREANTLLDEITITADTPSQTLSWSLPGVEAIESDGSMVFTILRQGGTNGTVSVAYATADDTATSSYHYTAVSGTVSLPNGVTSTNITVNVANNTAYAAVPVRFTITLSAPSGAILAGNPVAYGQITDDEPAPTARRAQVVTVKAGTVSTP